MTSALEVSEGAIKTHWQVFTNELAKVEMTGLQKAEVSGSFAGDLAFAVLSGPSIELTNRHRGGRVAALPIHFGSEASAFWVSYREQWSLVDHARFRYRSADLTFFQGASGSIKDQLFRAEWPGFTDWGAGVIGWQAPGAGHPHWQFDALETYASADARRAEVERLVSLLRTSGEQIEEFSEEDVGVAGELNAENTPDIRWTGMHFASQAQWSSQAWFGNLEDISSHSSAPESPKQVRDWTISVLSYARHELRRLVESRRR